MNDPRLQFLCIDTFPNGFMSIVKFVPFVPVMIQEAETHMGTQKFLQANLQYYIPQLNNV